MTHRIRLILSATLILAACANDPQTNFTAGRTEISCAGDVPVCTLFAGCTLDESNYTSGSFTQGADQLFIVNTTGPATISVEIFFTSEQSPGVDTEVTWYESGCAQSEMSASDGSDVFAEAGANLVWTRSQLVTTAGDHLIDLFSDAQANYLLRVQVLPGS